MSNLSRRSALLVLLFASFLASTACKFTGGGWLFAPQGTGKATFSFNAQCDKHTATIKGQGQYSDKVNRVNVHLIPTTIPFLQGECIPEVSFSPGFFSGTYTPQPKTGPGGTFEVIISDGGEPGPSTGDYYSLTLTGGIYDGYHNEGQLQGGNVQIQ